MTRLIDADALKYKQQVTYKKGDSDELFVEWFITATEIDNAPTVDAIPVEFVAEMFGNDEPCNFTLFGVDIDDFMFSKCGDWCEKNCDTATPIECWKKFAEAIREWKGEQHG